jgi:thiol-disulfide isomerase/thioredoxin
VDLQREGQAVRVVPCLLLIAGLFLGGSGCSLFNKRSKDTDQPSSKAPKGKEPARFPVSGGDPVRDGTAAADPQEAILAGTILDQYSQRPREAFIRYEDLNDNKKTEAPIEVATIDGYFTIRGLKPNHQYKLIARAKDGSRMLACIAYETAPNPHVVIRLKEENASADTPPIPGPPAYQPKKDKKEAAQFPQQSPAMAQGATKASGWTPVTANQAETHPVPRAAPQPVPDLPVQVNIPSQGKTPPPPSNGWVPGIAGTPTSWPPTLKSPSPLPQTPVPAVSVPPGWDKALGPTRVPSCVLVGEQLVNFALYDLNHQPWEYRTGHTGKLVLLDFWGTWCMPCRKTIPHLRMLQSKYASAGLEIIGIAYEHNSTFEEQARVVRLESQKLWINYRLLMGSGYQCPVRNSFAIRSYPSLVLVDENGRIIWRHEGQLSQYELDELDLIIRRRLGMN